MDSIAIRFQTGVVFRVCVECKKILGCYHLGRREECSSCSKNCLFRKTRISVEGYQLLEKNDSSTGSLCNECFLFQSNLIYQEKSAKLNNISIQ